MVKQHVAVLYGGLSAEREVSLRSGEACARALEQQGFRVTRLDVDRTIGQQLAEIRPDVAFNALHGRFGEDGTIQGILEVMAIPYTHSGVLASALALHKHNAKTVMAAVGIPVAEGFAIRRSDLGSSHPMPPPYVIKPMNEGSSVGVLIVGENAQFPLNEIDKAGWQPGEELLVEKFVAGRELTCAVWNDKPSEIIEIRAANGGWYDYEAKYGPGGSTHHLPANLKENIYQFVQDLALRAHRALGCRGVSRADFRFDDRPGGTGELVVLEVNTQPGMTETSLVPELAAYVGLSFGEFVQWMVEDASCDR